MKTKVAEYRVVSADMAKSLQAEVNGLIKEGWQPWGNLMVNSPVLPEGEVDLELFQVMVKYDPVPEGVSS